MIGYLSLTKRYFEQIFGFVCWWSSAHRYCNRSKKCRPLYACTYTKSICNSLFIYLYICIYNSTTLTSPSTQFRLMYCKMLCFSTQSNAGAPFQPQAKPRPYLYLYIPISYTINTRNIHLEFSNFHKHLSKQHSERCDKTLRSHLCAMAGKMLNEHRYIICMRWCYIAIGFDGTVGLELFVYGASAMLVDGFKHIYQL